MTILLRKILNQLNQKIELINAKYVEVKQVNMNILLLIESLVNNYNEDYPNYCIYNNIINNCNLSLSKCEKEDDCDTVIDYFSNFLLNEDNLKQAEFNFREIKTIEIKENITSLFVLNNGKILCCTNGTNIKIFNPNDNYNCESIIKLNEKKPIRIYTQLSNGHIIISSNDKVLQFMTISGSTFKEEFAMNTPYQCQITRILSISHDRYVILPKDEPNISVWSSLIPYSQVPLGFMYHRECSSMFQLNNKEILLTISFCTFKLFDLTNYQVIKIIQDLSIYICQDCIQLDDENILSSYL